MFEALIGFFIRNRLITAMGVLAIVVAGVYALSHLPVDAVPDITNNQVQVVTVSPSYAPQEVEQMVTFPIEMALSNVPGIHEVRSISRYGLSVVTAVFEDQVPMLDARQYVREQLAFVTGELPPGAGEPQLMPITTGLGEIYQYVLNVEPAYREHYSPTRLRSIQDWIVKRGLAGIPGIVEVSSFGGFLKQYEVAVDPGKAAALDVTLPEVVDALHRNNENTGAGYLESGDDAWYIRTEGIAASAEALERIEVAHHDGVPVTVRDIAEVREGHALRMGAMTADGKGEAVGGIALLLKGASSSQTLDLLKARVAQVQTTLPMGVTIAPFLDRAELIGRTTSTVRNNLLEGGLIVVLVLVLLLGNLRAGLIVASVIPLAMLFAFWMMHLFGVSANLMSLGAIDFGIVVDGAVIIVESILHSLFHHHRGERLSRGQLADAVQAATARIYQSSAFGVLIILVVFLPILSLTGIEGKMFGPMAQTVSFAILGALILSMTYVPMVSALVLSRNVPARPNLSDRFMEYVKAAYLPSLRLALRWKGSVVAFSLALLVGAVFLFGTMGGEFIPTLEEGDLAMQMSLPAGSTLSASVRASTQAEQILLKNFPEVKHVVSKIGTAEVPTDPMAVEDADIMIILKPKSEWTSAATREGLVDKMKAALEVVPRASFEFTQPIQLRFNELMTGAKADVAVKIYGSSLASLARLGEQAAAIIADIPGAADVKLEKTEGLPQLRIVPDRAAMAQFGVTIEDFNHLVRTAYLGTSTGVIFEEEKRFELVVRLRPQDRATLDLSRLLLTSGDGMPLPLSAVARIDTIRGPMMISREKAQRRIVIGVNVRERDVESLVHDIQARIGAGLQLPVGYRIEYGGQFENLQAARQRLAIAVPIALLLIFGLLYFSFGTLKHALLIYMAVPLSAIGGVAALWLRDLPFSISAGVGFIALFGVAVLNGIVLISHFEHLRKAGSFPDIRDLVANGAADRLRPVMMTALVASLGFLPMAVSNSAGAEVQRPLATVVIGGLVTASFLTLILLPLLYAWVEGDRQPLRRKRVKPAVVGLLLLFSRMWAQAQTPVGEDARLDSLVARSLRQSTAAQNGQLQVQAAALERDKAFALPQPTADLSLGQMNTSAFDFNLQLAQPLGNLRAYAARARWADQFAGLAAADQALALHLRGHQIRSAWQEWRHRQERLRLLTAQWQRYDRYLASVELRHQNGDISGMERALMQSTASRAELAVQQAGEELLQAALALREASQLPLPEGLDGLDSLLILSLPAQVDTGRVADPLRDVARRQEALAEAQLGIARAQLFPEFRVGYFEQSLDHALGFRGLTVGLSVPIWNRAMRAEVAQQDIARTITRNASALQSQQLEWQRRQAIAAWLSTRRAWEIGREAAAAIPLLRQSAEAALRLGSFSYFELLQQLNLVTELELAQADACARHNQALLRVLFFTQIESQL